LRFGSEPDWSRRANRATMNNSGSRMFIAIMTTAADNASLLLWPMAHAASFAWQILGAASNARARWPSLQLVQFARSGNHPAELPLTLEHLQEGPRAHLQRELVSGADRGGSSPLAGWSACAWRRCLIVGLLLGGGRWGGHRRQIGMATSVLSFGGA
jgi:hypothetical protein